MAVSGASSAALNAEPPINGELEDIYLAAEHSENKRIVWQKLEGNKIKPPTPVLAAWA